MANDLTFTQISTVLNDIVNLATGNEASKALDYSTFVNQAQLALKMGYDPVLNSISQVMARTIFSIRPYTRKFKGIEADNQRWGNHVRKINWVDKDWENDARYTLTDGETVDMYKINLPKVMQTNFYGANTFERYVTILRDQLDNAFRGPEELARFMTGTMQNISDIIEQSHESLARATVVNFIAAKYTADTTSVIHLLTEYNTLIGAEPALTINDIYKPDNFKPFMQWVFGRIQGISSMMTERSEKFQLNITGKPISRHTPVERQKIYMYAPSIYYNSTMNLANTFHPDFIKMGNFEAVNYWQSIDSPDNINITASYTDVDGTVKKSSAVNIDNVLGVIFDEEALGYTVVNQWSAPTPFNAKGGYSNIFWHFTDKYWNDLTEKGVVLMLN